MKKSVFIVALVLFTILAIGNTAIAGQKGGTSTPTTATYAGIALFALALVRIGAPSRRTAAPPLQQHPCQALADLVDGVSLLAYRGGQAMTRWWGGILLFALLTSLALMPDAAAQQPVDVTVNCSSRHSITHVLQTVSGSPLTITVRGTCHENVTITRNDVTLRGAAPGSGITGPDATLNTITIISAQRVMLDNLTVSGGSNGVMGWGGAAFTVKNSTIQNTGANGIVVRSNSRAWIESNTVTGNASSGIVVRGSSNGSIINNTVQSNTTFGIVISEGSSARIGVTEGGTAAGNLIEGSGADGISVSFTSSAILYGNTIQHNGLSGGYEGISVTLHSTLALLGLNTITANTGPGIFLRSSSLRTGRMGGWTITPNTNEISNNIGGGIDATQNSLLDLRDGLTITNNQSSPNWFSFGLSLDQGSRLRISDTTVTGNARGGILLSMASTAVFRGGNNISANTGYDLQCQNGAGSSYSGGNLPPNTDPSCTPF